MSPLTDEEIGQVGNLPWDGVPGPRVMTTSGGEFAEYTSIVYADYVANALAGKFSMRVTAHIADVHLRPHNTLDPPVLMATPTTRPYPASAAA